MNHRHHCCSVSILRKFLIFNQSKAIISHGQPIKNYYFSWWPHYTLENIQCEKVMDGKRYHVIAITLNSFSPCVLLKEFSNILYTKQLIKIIKDE